MAEITITGAMKVLKSFLKYDVPAATLNVVMNGTHKAGATQDIGTTHELIVVPAELATLGWAFFMNTDAANYVEIGRDVAATFYPVLKLKAGEWTMVRLAAVALYARANTAAVKLDYMIIED